MLNELRRGASFRFPWLIASLLALSLTPTITDAAPDSEKDQDKAVELNPAEQAFSEMLSNVVLTGHFTVEGDSGETKPEKYQIVSAAKTGEHDWLINARIAYGEGSEKIPPLPIPVKVHWAGDTPVLSLTDLTIPGLGTFTSRVMFFENRYAGTWQHGEKGGHLFGTISKAE